jgi:hypothetical protein
MRKLLFLSLLCITSFNLLAQPGDPGGGEDPDVPITGIEILLGVGGALGARKLAKRKNKTQ